MTLVIKYEKNPIIYYTIKLTKFNPNIQIQHKILNMIY